MEYTDKILKVAETIVAGMKSLQKPATGRPPVMPVHVSAAAPPAPAAAPPAGTPPPAPAAAAPAGAPPPNTGTAGEQKKLLQTAEIQRITAANEKDPYGVLGLKPGASLNEIIKAYKQIARLVHPNTPLGNKVVFQKLQGAYSSLNPKNNYNIEGGRRRITVNRHLSRRSRSSRRTTYRR